jgi:hypothetical protein
LDASPSTIITKDQREDAESSFSSAEKRRQNTARLRPRSADRNSVDHAFGFIDPVSRASGPVERRTVEKN